MKMQNKHITKWGSPQSGSRALYFVHDQDGLIQMDIDMELEQLRVKGRVITPDIKKQISEKVKSRRTEYNASVTRLGIPESLQSLLLTTSKSEAEKYARNITVTEYDLFLLIHNCNQLRLTHRAKFKQYVPDHLKISDTDRNEMKTDNPKDFFKKLYAGLEQRRYIHVHLFEYSSDWHCIFFSHQDIEPTDNHWKYGCHLHYISHLWSNLDKRRVWNQFNKRSTEISGNLHIKFEPFNFSKLNEANNQTGDKQEQPPQLIIFNPTLANGLGSIPLPVAHLTTRGLWITTVSFLHKKVI
jgi:hypothetical protein